MNNKMKMAVSVGLLALAQTATASTFTSIAPNGVDVTAAGVTEIGGIVVLLNGANGASSLSQLAASTLHEGYANDAPGSVDPYNPLTIGTQAGYDTVTASLGGGLTSAYFRFTLEDGDSAAGDFDDGEDNSLLVNGVNVGFWSEVDAQTTDSMGVADGNGIAKGFEDDKLDTGWFSVTDTTQLADIFTQLTLGTINFGIDDVDPADNYFDFTLGIDGSLINVGSGPVVTPNPMTPSAVPVPAALPLMASALGLFGFARRRKNA